MVLRPVRREPSLLRQQRGYFIIDQYKPKATDPYFDDVVQLAHFDDLTGSPTTTFLNSCSRGNTLTSPTGPYGEVSDVTSVFGGASLRRRLGTLVGTPAAQTTAHADYQFGTNDWTIEFWYYQPSFAANYNIIDMRDGVNGNTVVIYVYANGRVGLYVNSAERIVSAAGALSAGVWAGISAARVSGSTRLFVNGTQVGSTWSDSTNYNASARIALADNFGGNPPVGTHWDELRITNGTGRYASNYTLTDEPFPDA